MVSRKCKFCNASYTGRFDKIFCSLKCKNDYHVLLRRDTDTNSEVKRVDKILHRNRSILVELINDNKVQKKVPRALLDKKAFKYDYHTGRYINSRNKVYHYIYDFGWMEFNKGEILIIRRGI